MYYLWHHNGVNLLRFLNNHPTKHPLCYNGGKRRGTRDVILKLQQNKLPTKVFKAELELCTYNGIAVLNWTRSGYVDLLHRITNTVSVRSWS